MNQNRSILECRSLVELLEQRATLTPNAIAYVRLEDGRTESDSLTYAQMDRRARAIAVRLRLRYALGSRCMLLFTHSFDAMVAFMGCLYAGMVPVPIPAPVGSRVKRALPRVEAVMRDSQAIAILSTFSTASSLSSEHGLQQLGGMDIFHLEDVPDHLADQWSIPPTDPRGVAYLQYTSGSTSSPKGVMVSHHNILHHSECLRKAWGYDESSVSATWMPYYHDYGLVDGLIQPLYSGIPCYVMSSLAFIKRPIRWLEIISRYGVTHSQGPNFAYEYCIRRIATQDLDNVNLISWRTASNGAETIRAETAERFIAKFAPFGFRPEAFFPTYGLAEATLVVSTKRRETLWNCVTVDAHAMERCRVVLTSCASRAARRVVSCGIAAPHVTIAIVNLDLRQRCSANEIGEVWVSGPSVTQGYWNRPEESSKLFEARIVGDPRPYLRTGDLGFVLNDEVFITGRLKDLVIVAGANHHPEDIEWTVQSAHAAIRADAVAAFSVDRGGEERLVVAAEFEKVGSDLTEVAESVRAALAEVHDLQLDTFVFLRHGEIPKTSSFKVQRYACRQAFLDGQWRVVGIWNAPSGQGVSLNEFDDMGVSKQRAPLSSPEAATAKSGSPVTDPAESAPDRKMPPGYAEITDWLCARMSRLTGEAARRLDWNAPFSSYGATSRELVSLIGELEQFLGTSLSSTLPWNYPTIRSLASFLAGGTTRRVPDADTSESHVDRRVTESREGIAVVGIGCRFPGGGRGPGGYWQMLRGGRDAVGDAPEWRGLGAGLRGGFVEDVDRFDAGFFGISPREATVMDPQQRLLLEVGWEALEDAGIRPGGLAGSNTGVFIGISNNDFFLRFSQSSNWDRHIATGGAPSIAANRISYFLDLRGPSIAIDTACSSSLVAVHQACQSLKTGEINLAMAGGVNLILDDCWNQVLANAQMLSPTGRCHSFQSTADGYVRGEGGGMVILKRVSDAVKDGDRIIAVIKGHAVNQDGRSNGLTAPNGLAQQDVIRRALSMANIRADRVGYVEAHGTGTRIGDPIEFHALRTIVGRETPDRKTCYVGSVKSNIGHLEAAAGIAGLIKVILSLHHQYIPPSLLRADINEQLQPADFLKIADSGRVWESRDRRVAAVSSFGFGGTNAHVVVEEEAPAISPATPVALPQTSFPLAVCAHSSAALGVVARSYESWIREALQVDPTVRLGDLCAAVNGVRSQLPCRRVLNVRTSTDALRQLEELANDADRMAIPLHYAPVQALFVFGNTNPSDSAFAERLVALCDRFREAEFRARALVEAAYDPNGGDESRRHITFQVALCRLLVDLGVVPSGYVAKGSGELAARIAATMIPLTRQPLDSESLRGDSLMIAMGSDNPLAPSNEPVGDAWNWLLNQLATAYQSGFDIAWERLYGSDARRRTPPLPAYPWQREKYWPAGDRANNVNCTSSATDFRGAGGGPAIGDGAQRELSMEVDGGDRGVTNEDYLNTVFQMAETVFGSPSLELREFVVFCRPHAAAALRVTMTRSAHDSVHFRVLDNTLKGGSLGLKCCAEGAVYSLDKPTVPRGAV